MGRFASGMRRWCGRVWRGVDPLLCCVFFQFLRKTEN